MDTEALHILFQQVIQSSEHYGNVVAVFGENSKQAKKALAAYNSSFTTWSRESHWEEFCSLEGPWQPECRIYDC